MHECKKSNENHNTSKYAIINKGVMASVIKDSIKFVIDYKFLQFIGINHEIVLEVFNKIDICIMKVITAKLKNQIKDLSS